MRGDNEQQLDVFSYVSPEQRIPQDHPLRPVRAMADEALRELKPCFSKLYAKTGRPSIAPEKLLRALLLQVLYSVRSERMLKEHLNYNLLFRWFVGLNMDNAIWDATVFSKNRQRLLAGDIADAFFEAVLKQARRETYFRMNTSPWMEPCWKRGLGRRVFAVSMTISSHQHHRAKRVAFLKVRHAPRAADMRGGVASCPRALLCAGRLRLSEILGFCVKCNTRNG